MDLPKKTVAGLSTSLQQYFGAEEEDKPANDHPLTINK
jgi:hypothetical protein